VTRVSFALLIVVLSCTGGCREYQPSGESNRAEVEAAIWRAADSTTAFWRGRFAVDNSAYEEPDVALVNSGDSDLARSPAAYAPGFGGILVQVDQFDLLSRRFGGATSTLAELSVAHEVAHHVQATSNALNGLKLYRSRSAWAELQADCLAGVWYRSVYPKAVSRDIGQLYGKYLLVYINAMSNSERREDFTSHGSPEKRVAALVKGLQANDIAVCGS
jgi:predicted metalloprotease